MISIIVPSRGRPQALKEALQSLEIDKNGLEALVWLDNDDPSLGRYKELFGTNPHIKLFIKKRVGYKNFQHMLNFLSKEASFDWIFEFNDDAYITDAVWFTMFCNFVREFEPKNQPVVINIWGQGDTQFNLFPIVSRKFIDILDHFALMYTCDDYVQRVALGASIVYNLNGIKTVHRKYGGVDPLVDQTFKEVEADRAEMKQSHDPRRSPYRQMIRADIAKIVAYNQSIESVKTSEQIKEVGFIGLGKLGLPIAETMAKRGFHVLGYDIKPVTTSLPLASTLRELVEKSDLVFCAVQTPHQPAFEGDKPLPAKRADFDYSHLKKVVRQIASFGKPTNLVVISTCLPDTFRTKIKPLLKNKINYLYNPFFTATGTVVEDFLNPEFVLIGGDDTAILKHFYTKLYGRDRTFITDITTAEGIKVFYNTFITTKTILGNMYGEYAHKLGMNVDHIYQALSRATDRIISPRYLKSGVADGGSCHPRDNIALSFLAKKIGISFNFFDAILAAREKHMEWLANIFKKNLVKRKMSGIILGKSFKPNTDIQSGSAAILLANILKRKNVPFKQYEFNYPTLIPAVYFIATQHSQYANIHFPPGSVVIDPFRYISKQKDVEVISIGTP